VTWANFLYVNLGRRIPLRLFRDVIDEKMSECFKTLYPKSSVIIDCTEMKTQTQSSLVVNSQMYSNYKSACTVKCLLGISPHGVITFISGCMADVEITKLSGILDLLEENDSVMADKGFTIRIYKLKRCSNKECCKQCRYVMYKFLYGPFCHGALKHAISTLFTTFFV